MFKILYNHTLKSFISTFTGILKSLELTKIFVSKLGYPVLVFPLFSLIHTLHSTRVVCPDFLVKMILGVRDYAKVRALIIKAITVNMVDKHIVRWIHNKSVHMKYFPSFPTSIYFYLFLGIKSIKVFSGVPLQFIEFVKVFIVNNNPFILSNFNIFHVNILINNTNIVNAHTNKTA